MVASSLLSPFLSAFGCTLFHAVATRRWRFWPYVAQSDPGNAQDAGASSLSARVTHMGGVSPDWGFSRAFGSSRWPAQVWSDQASHAGFRWDFCVFHRAAAGCSHSWGNCHRALGIVRRLLGVRKVLPPLASRLYGYDRDHDVSVGCESVFSWGD